VTFEPQKKQKVTKEKNTRNEMYTEKTA